MSHIIPCSQTALHLLFFYKGKASKENSSTTHKGMFLYCSYQKYSPALLILFLKSMQYWRRAEIHTGHDGLKILEPRLLSSLRVSQTTTSTYCKLLASRSSATPCKSFFTVCQIALKEPREHTDSFTRTFYFPGFTNTYWLHFLKTKSKLQEEAVNYSKHFWLETAHIEC